MEEHFNIKNGTKRGYLEAYEGDGVDLAYPSSEHRRARVQAQTIQTLDTAGGSTKGVVVKEPKVLGGIGDKKSNNNTQWYLQDRIYDDNVAVTVATQVNPYYKSGLRIRRLTPRECFRLQGVRDNDYENCARNQNDASLFHLAGDSITVNVLMAIFRELL